MVSISLANKASMAVGPALKAVHRIGVYRKTGGARVKSSGVCDVRKNRAAALQAFLRTVRRVQKAEEAHQQRYALS